MEQVTICMVCNRNISKHSCIRCGALVCDDCFSKKRNLCVGCITGRR